MNFHAMAPKKYKRSVVAGMVHRIYRSCSSWANIHESLDKARKILFSNQYPEDFYEPIIHQTLTKLIVPPGSEECEKKDTEDDSEEEEMENVSASSELEGTADSVPAHCDEWHKDKYDHFKFFIQYRGKCTEQFAKALHNCKAP